MFYNTNGSSTKPTKHVAAAIYHMLFVVWGLFLYHRVHERHIDATNGGIVKSNTHACNVVIVDAWLINIFVYIGVIGSVARTVVMIIVGWIFV